MPWHLFNMINPVINLSFILVKINTQLVASKAINTISAGDICRDNFNVLREYQEHNHIFCLFIFGSCARI